MILVDTNVWSEYMRASPNKAAMNWQAHHQSQMQLCSIVLAELSAGIAILPKGKRRTALTQSLATLSSHYKGKIYGFDEQSAYAYAHILATARQAGRNIMMADAMIAAIATANGFSIATRNVKDFEGLGVELINPWDFDYKA